MRQASSGSLLASVLAETGMFAVAAHARWRAAPPAPGFGRQRFGAGGPDAQRRLHADYIGQTAGRDVGAERAVGAIPSVGQQDARSDAAASAVLI